MGGPPNRFKGFTDSDWASQPHHHLVSRYIFRVGAGTVTWSSKKQSLIALSSTEAEYITQTHTMKEAIWLHSYWSAITSAKLTSPSKLLSDNQGTITLAKSATYRTHTKHIDIQYHFIHNTVERQAIPLMYCPTKDMVADILMKAIPHQQFDKLRKLMGVRAA
jgi:hypothetical protein